MTFPSFSDLGALAETLGEKGKSSVLRKALTQAWRAQSCLSDLQQAHDCCAIIRDRLPSSTIPDSRTENTIAKALLTSAVSLYARATSTSGKGQERGSIQLDRKHLSEELWEDHSSLLALRNNALAHVNPSHMSKGGLWHRSKIFAVRAAPESWKPASASSEFGLDYTILSSLERVMPLATDLISKQYFKRMETVLQELRKEGVSDDQLLAHAFDPVDFFGDAALVERILAQGNFPASR